MKKLIALAALALLSPFTAADETCMSPYMAKIVGQGYEFFHWKLPLSSR